MTEQALQEKIFGVYDSQLSEKPERCRLYNEISKLNYHGLVSEEVFAALREAYAEPAIAS